MGDYLVGQRPHLEGLRSLELSGSGATGAGDRGGGAAPVKRTLQPPTN